MHILCLVRSIRIQHDHWHSQNFIGRSGNYQEVQNGLCQFFWRVLIEIPHLKSLITQRWETDPTWPFILFINWWVTWYDQKLFYISYCHNVEEKKSEVNDSRYTSNWSIFCTDLKNINFVIIRSSNRKFW